jgi:hypothetical protein
MEIYDVRFVQKQFYLLLRCGQKVLTGIASERSPPIFCYETRRAFCMKDNYWSSALEPHIVGHCADRNERGYVIFSVFKYTTERKESC